MGAALQLPTHPPNGPIIPADHVASIGGAKRREMTITVVHHVAGGFDEARPVLPVPCLRHALTQQHKVLAAKNWTATPNSFK